jgi:iron complex transport system substrate-binding protein
VSASPREPNHTPWTWLSACSAWLCWVFVVWCGVAQPAAAAQAIEVRDDRGAWVRLPAPPQRIVSLLPSLTETVCDLGACERIVATDRWSNWPARIQGLPKVGGLDDPNIELIVAQRPDLVLVAPSSRLAGRLRGLGLSVAEFDANTLAQAEHVMRQVAALLGMPERGVERWQALEAGLDAAAAQVPAAARGQRVYFEISSTPFAAGEASFIGQVLSRLGARHAVPAELGPFPKLNPEYLVKADPDLIIVSVQDAPGLSQRPGWSGMKAVAGAAKGRVCALNPAEMDVLARPGPRLAQGAQVLLRCLVRAGGAR